MPISMEKSKHRAYTLANLDKQMRELSIRIDHPNQRVSEQWNAEIRDNFIADAIAGNPFPAIIICEQMKDGIPVRWIVDGKQRSTTLVKYMHNTFKLGKNIDRYMVKYVHIDNTEEGHSSKIMECDVRGKYYKDLPEELRDAYDMYEVQTDMFLDCTDDDVNYHLKRYNRCRPMTAAQKGIIYLGCEYAKVVKKLAKHTFFMDRIGKYTDADIRNGIIDRIITETVMATNFLSNWVKSTNKMCAYLNEHVSVQRFNVLEGYLDRLASVVDDDVRDMFNNKDSFLLFTLFDRFVATGKDDEEFVSFLKYFRDNLMDKKYDGMTYLELNEKNTKDKNIISKKLSLMEYFMYDFLHVKKENKSDLVINDRKMLALINDCKETDVISSMGITDEELAKSIIDFIAGKKLDDKDYQTYYERMTLTDEMVSDIGLYMSILSDWSLSLPVDCGIICKENLADMLAIVRYTIEKENDDEFFKWFIAHTEIDVKNIIPMFEAENQM